MISFEQKILLRFEGDEADHGVLDFYDAAQALIGFQRSLALTTHFVLNGTVITQAPALKGAQISVQPPSMGSWLIVASIIGGVGYLGSRPKDTPLGHLVYSVYDYVLMRTMGIHIDYDKSIRQLVEERVQEDTKHISEGRLDDLSEKCENAIKEMHRPIVNSGTAEAAGFSTVSGSKIVPLKSMLTEETFEALDFERRSVSTKIFEGMVSSYNMNTRTGRLYVKELARTIPFKIADSYLSRSVSTKIARNMTKLADGETHTPIVFEAFENQSRNGRLRSILVVRIRS
ncbi:MAG: hypothetical protein ACK46Q_05555 [Hyphomonas sp.]